VTKKRILLALAAVEVVVLALDVWMILTTEED